MLYLVALLCNRWRQISREAETANSWRREKTPDAWAVWIVWAGSQQLARISGKV